MNFCKLKCTSIAIAALLSVQVAAQAAAESVAKPSTKLSAKPITGHTIEQKDYILNLLNADLTLVQADLDTKRFFGARMLLRVSHLTDNSFSAMILNDICPKVPGKPSCLAMPYPLLSADFKLKEAQVDSCGVITRESNAVSHTSNSNEKETVRVVVRDYRFMTCEIKYIADLEVKLKIKGKKLESHSKLWLNFKNPKNDDNQEAPVKIIKPPKVIKPAPGYEDFVTTQVESVHGPFFKGTTDLSADISIDELANSIYLNVMGVKCEGIPCEGFQSLIDRELKIESIKSNKCGELTYFTEEKSVYDAYPAVLGAKKTFVTLQLKDSRRSLCGGADSKGISALVLVVERKKLNGPEIIVSESEALFQLSIR